MAKRRRGASEEDILLLVLFLFGALAVVGAMVVSVGAGVLEVATEPTPPTPITATPEDGETPVVTPEDGETPVVTPEDGDTPTVTPTFTPTPDTQAPTIRNVTAFPESIFDIPGCDGPTVTSISASVIDPSGVAQVTVHWLLFDGVDFGALKIVGASFNPDSREWEATLDPLPVVSDPGRIEYYVQARGNSGNTNRVPALGESRSVIVKKCFPGPD